MTRLSPLSMDDLDDEQRALLDTISSGPRGLRGMVGPFAVLVRIPTMGDAAQNLGAVVRYGTALADNVKEVAICTVGVFYRARYEFAAHAGFARKAGVTDDVIEALRTGATPLFADAGEAIAHRVATALLVEHRLSDTLYAEAVELLGEEQLVELVVTTGYYVTISMLLNAFEVPLGDEMIDPFPDDALPGGV